LDHDLFAGAWCIVPTLGLFSHKAEIQHVEKDALLRTARNDNSLNHSLTESPNHRHQLLPAPPPPLEPPLLLDQELPDDDEPELPDELPEEVAMRAMVYFCFCSWLQK
jgi:hypothetical protein